MSLVLRTDVPLLTDHLHITKRIGAFWDKISSGWRTIWGPHIHHGYYDIDQLTPIEAQERLIEKLASHIHIKPHERILDAGCGMGGSSIYLAEHFQAEVIGITLSPTQLEIAEEQIQQNNTSHVAFKIEDATHLKSFPANSFDIVWSLESCEQFYNKKNFIQEAFRVLKPGGRLMLATWCSDRDRYEGRAARRYKKLCKAFDLPYMPTIIHYENLIVHQGFQLNLAQDWSPMVARSWNVGLSMIKRFNILKLLKIGGLKGLNFARKLKLMRNAFNDCSVRYGVFIATKP